MLLSPIADLHERKREPSEVEFICITSLYDLRKSESCRSSHCRVRRCGMSDLSECFDARPNRVVDPNRLSRHTHFSIGLFRSKVSHHLP